MSKKILAILMAMAMCICFCACGNSEGSTEETVEITTVAQDQQDEEENEISVYHQIYDEYAGKMEAATKDYRKDIEAKADDLSNDDLYDLVKEKIDELSKICEEGSGRMTDAMLASTDDDDDIYQKWYDKLSEKFSELQRELSGIYTDRF